MIRLKDSPRLPSTWQPEDQGMRFRAILEDIMPVYVVPTGTGNNSVGGNNVSAEIPFDVADGASQTITVIGSAGSGAPLVSDKNAWRIGLLSPVVTLAGAGEAVVRAQCYVPPTPSGSAVPLVERAGLDNMTGNGVPFGGWGPWGYREFLHEYLGNGRVWPPLCTVSLTLINPAGNGQVTGFWVVCGARLPADHPAW